MEFPVPAPVFTHTFQKRSGDMIQRRRYDAELTLQGFPTKMCSSMQWTRWENFSFAGLSFSERVFKCIVLKCVLLWCHRGPRMDLPDRWRHPRHGGSGRFVFWFQFQACGMHNKDSASAERGEMNVLAVNRGLNTVCSFLETFIVSQTARLLVWGSMWKMKI